MKFHINNVDNSECQTEVADRKGQVGMTNRKRFFFNGTLLTIVGLLMKTAALLFGAFVSRTVGAEGTGLYTLVMTVYSFAVTFATSGISLTVTRLVASAIGEDNRGEISKIMKGAILYSLAFSLVATGVLFLGADFFGERVLLDLRSVLSLRILSLSLVPCALSSVFTGYFVGVRRVSSNAAVQVLTQFFKVAVTVLLVLRMSEYGTAMAVGALCIGITLSEAISFLLIFVQFLIDRAKHKNKGDRGVSISPVARMALPLAFSAYIRSGLLTLEHILIPKKLSERGKNSSEALADYGTLHGMSLPLVLYPMSPLSSFSGLLVPEFAESLSAGDTERMKRITRESINTTLTYAIAIAVFLYLFSEELGYIVYDSYSAGKYIALIAPIVPIMYLDHVTDSMLKGIGEQVYSMWVNISDSVLSIILVWILIPKMGIAGYAVVIIVMEAYNFTLSLVRLKSKLIFTIKPFLSIICPIVCATAAALLSKNIFSMNGRITTPYWLVMKIIFAAAVFLALYVCCHCFFGGKPKFKNLKSEKTA